MRYYLKAPHGRGVSFRIILNHRLIRNEALEATNKAFKAGTLSRHEASKALKELTHKLNLEFKDKRVFNADNERVVIQYWNKEYARRSLVDPASSRSALNRAVKAIGNLSLTTASFEELQNSVYTLIPNKQRRVVQSLNQLLKFLNRDFKLNKARPTKAKVKYLTETELTLILPHLPNEAIRFLHQVCFYTGARIGEAFALDTNSILQDTIRIFEQVDKKGELRETKNRKQRYAFLVDKAVPVVKRWILVKGAIDANTRERMAKITRAACKKAFPTNKDKHCKFHDMRHSYAIGLVSKGVSLTAVSQCLGNSVAVCERYYVGYQLTTETVQMIKKLVVG